MNPFQAAFLKASSSKELVINFKSLYMFNFHKRSFGCFMLVHFVFVTTIYAQQTEELSVSKSVKNALTVPIGGNTWANPSNTGASRLLNRHVISGWKDSNQSFTTYLRTSNKGNLDVWLDVEGNGQRSVLLVQIGSEKKEVVIASEVKEPVFLGTWNLDQTGYHLIHLKGIGNTSFPIIKGYLIEGKAAEGELNFVPTNDGNYFYWGRRGPSVHMTYTVPTEEPIAYYYNEMTVPEGSDVIGSYFMANGFAEGYFGIQVNSATERRVLFSVWSPFQTDDPSKIPEDEKITLLRKGHDVYTGEFGNEGSGGQSYLKYPWKAGNTYKFLLKGVPADNGYTTYTAWFYAPELGEWQLIASFNRPKTQTHLKRFHSFLENFIPEQGIYERKVSLSNQWVRDIHGVWFECTKGRFTIDQTGRLGYRKDYAGGVNESGFYLRNIGFFSDFTPVDSSFERTIKGIPPVIHFDELP